MSSILSRVNSIGIPAIINQYDIVDSDTNMVPFTQYWNNSSGGTHINYFFPFPLNSGDQFSIIDSATLGDVVTIAITPGSGTVILHNGITGTSITTGTGTSFTFFVPDAFVNVIIITSTNGATFRLNP